MEAQIDDEVKALVKAAYVRAMECLTANKPLLDDITTMLIDKETLDFTELQDLVGKYNPELAAELRVKMPPNLAAA